MHLTKNLEINC